MDTCLHVCIHECIPIYIYLERERERRPRQCGTLHVRKSPVTSGKVGLIICLHFDVLPGIQSVMYAKMKLGMNLFLFKFSLYE